MALRAVHASQQNVTDAGDILQIAVPLTALSGTFFADDPEGRWQFGKSFGLAIATVQAGKQIFKKLRPGSSLTARASFPSGHTAAATSGAAFIYSRYG